MDEHKLDRNARETSPSDEEKIDLYRLLAEFWKAFRRLFWLPVCLAVLCCAFFAFRAWWSYTPMYQAEVTFTIQTPTSGSTGDISSGSTYYDKAAAEQLSKTFPYLISSELLQNMLRQELGVESLNGTLTAQTVENTNLFSLQATSSSPQSAYDILTSVIQVYPRVADYVIGSTIMNLLTEPSVPTSPCNQLSLLRPAVKGAFLGCAAGLVLILLFAATRRSIRSSREVRSQLNQTYLGSLPQVSFKRRTRKTQEIVSIQNRRISGSFQEGVRRLRVKLLREAEAASAQVLMVTSTLPGEGKTTVASNLALSLSQNGVRVILVDLDLRKPSVKKNLGIKVPSRGADYLLSKGGNAVEQLIRLEGSSLRLLAGDQPADNPRKKSASRRLRAILAELRQEADYIILDTPPCGLLADSGAMATLADGTLYVIRAGVAQVSHVLDGLQFLGESGAKILGCVLNGVEGNHNGYGYGYYGYGYGGYSSYGYGYGSRKKRKGEDDSPEQDT